MKKIKFVADPNGADGVYSTSKKPIQITRIFVPVPEDDECYSAPALKILLNPEKFSKRKVIEAKKMVKAILLQKGCEHFDPAVDSGKLTDLMDIIIFG